MQVENVSTGEKNLHSCSDIMTTLHKCTEEEIGDKLEEKQQSVSGHIQ